MHGNRQFDVIQTIEQGGQCYPVLNRISGHTLEEACREGGYISKETFYEWSSQIISCVGNLHRCRPVKIYQFLTPYTVIIDAENRIYLLDTEHESNRETVRRMFERRIQSAFFPEESIGKRRPGIYHDLYTIGKTMQYILAKTEASHEMRRMEEYRMERMLRRVTGPDGIRGVHSADDVKTMLVRCRGRVTEGSARQPGKLRIREAGPDTGTAQPPQKITARRHRKYLAAMAAVVVMIAGAQVLFSRAEASGAAKGAEEISESSEREVHQSTEQGAESDEAKDADEDADGSLTELNLRIGLLYFEKLEDYEKSLESFRKAAEVSQRAAAYETLAKFYMGNYGVRTEDAESAVQEILKVAEDFAEPEKTEAMLDAIRIYEKLDKPDDALQLIQDRIGTLDDWKEGDEDKKIQNELYEKGASILESKGNLQEAIEMRTVLYDGAQEGEVYDTQCIKLASLYLQNQQYAEGETVGLAGIDKCVNRVEAAVICAKCICNNTGYDNAQKEERLAGVLEKVPEASADDAWRQVTNGIKK